MKQKMSALTGNISHNYEALQLIVLHPFELNYQRMEKSTDRYELC